jgi:hypothetical protein
MLWKNEKRERKTNYNCEACIAFKWNDRRACYLPYPPGKERYDFTLPIFDETTHPPSQTGTITYREQTEEDVLERLDEMTRVFPEVPEFELVNMYFKNPFDLCLTGIADPDIVALIELEAECTKYQVMPYAGGLQDQPTPILEAFSAVREAENEFNIKRFAEMSSKSDNSQRTLPGLPPRPHRQ